MSIETIAIATLLGSFLLMIIERRVEKTHRTTLKEYS